MSDELDIAAIRERLDGFLEPGEQRRYIDALLKEVESLAGIQSLYDESRADAEHWIEWGQQALRQVATLKEALEPVVAAQAEAIAVVRKRGFVFTIAPGDVNKPDMEDSERWEHLAFRFYSDIAQLSDRAKQTLEELEG